MAGKTPREVLTLPEADPACALAPEHSLITQLALDDAAAQTDFVYRDAAGRGPQGFDAGDERAHPQVKAI